MHAHTRHSAILILPMQNLLHTVEVRQKQQTSVPRFVSDRLDPD